MYPLTPQILFLLILLTISVAGTRLIYHDGLIGNLKRLEKHCRMLALLIVVTVTYAGSIGYRLNSYYERCLMDKENTIRMVQAKHISDIPVADCRTVVFPSGTTYTWTTNNGMRIGTGGSQQRIFGIGNLASRP